MENDNKKFLFRFHDNNCVVFKEYTYFENMNVFSFYMKDVIQLKTKTNYFNVKFNFQNVFSCCTGSDRLSHAQEKDPVWFVVGKLFCRVTVILNFQHKIK